MLMNSPFYTWYGLNEFLFHAINNIKYPGLNGFMELGTMLAAHILIVAYGPLLFLVAAAMFVKHWRAQRLSAATLWIVTIATFSGAFLIEVTFLSILKPLLDLPRPPLALGLEAVKILGKPRFHHSFPSGHASFAMTIVASLWLILPMYMRVAGTLFVIWVAVSRIYVGAHFPADVCAGMLSAFIIVLVVRRAVLFVTPGLVARFAGKSARLS